MSILAQRLKLIFVDFMVKSSRKLSERLTGADILCVVFSFLEPDVIALEFKAGIHGNYP